MLHALCSMHHAPCRSSFTIHAVFAQEAISFNVSLSVGGKYLQYRLAKMWPLSGIVRYFNTVDRCAKTGTHLAHLDVAIGVHY